MADDHEADSVRVILRFRPINKREQEEFGDKENKVKISFNSDKDLSISVPGQPLKSYTFDRVFPPVSQQIDVYESAARKSIDLVLQGYNATIFAYGQTGAGKSFTMFGPRIGDDKLAGVIPRAAKHVFQGVTTMDLASWKVECSFLELYNEEIRDLLSQAKNLQIHEGKDGIYVEGSEHVDCYEQSHVLELLVTGETHRATSATRMNEVSSRSHSIFILKVTQTDKQGRTLHGKLNLVDLAGSEKIKKTEATGSRLEEAKKINLSLTALGKCIHALTNGEAHVPFRESKLTRLLQESLGGNTKTTLLIAASPHEFNVEETISTLDFGKRAKKIALNVHINKVYSIEELQEIIARLKEERALLLYRIKVLENENAWMKSPDYKPGAAPPPISDAPPGGFDKLMSGEINITTDNTSPIPTPRRVGNVGKLTTELADLQAERDDLQQELLDKTEELENANRKINNFEQELANAIAAKDDEIRAKDSRIFELSEEQHIMTTRLDAMTNESSMMSEQLSSLQIMVKDRDELENMCSEMQKENDGLVDDLMNKEKELNAAKDAISEHKKKLKQKEREYAKLEDDLKKTQDDMSQVELKSQEDMEYILQELNTLNERNSELEAQLKQASIAQEVKSGSYTNVDRAVSEQLQKLQRDVEAKERERTKMEKSYESKIESLSEKLKSVKNDMEVMDQANQSLETQLMESEAEKEKYMGEVDELSKKQAQMSTRFGAAQMNIKRLEADIRNLQEKMAKDSTERVDIMNTNLSLQTDLMKSKLAVSQKARQVDSMQNEISEIKAELNASKSERSQLKLEVTASQEKNERLLFELQNAKKLIADLEADCDMLARKRGISWTRRVVGDPFRDKVDFANFKLKETNSRFTAEARKEAEIADKDFNDRMKKLVQSIDPTAQAHMSFGF